MNNVQMGVAVAALFLNEIAVVVYLSLIRSR